MQAYGLDPWVRPSGGRRIARRSESRLGRNSSSPRIKDGVTFLRGNDGRLHGSVSCSGEERARANRAAQAGLAHVHALLSPGRLGAGGGGCCGRAIWEVGRDARLFRRLESR